MRRAKQWAMIVMIFTVVFSMFGGTALGASTRFALVTDVSGTVKVTKAGGTKEIQVFKGMGLNEGDKLKVGKDSSVTLKVADRDDEVVLGSNWNGTLSKLKDKAGGSDTAVKTWAGSMYNKVEKITGSNSTYKVETPTAVMGVRGTHFTVSIDPITGLPTMFVSAGKVAASEPGQQGDGAVVLPAQQITVYPDAPPEAGVDYIDPETLVKVADKDVIAAMLKNKTLIDEENEEILSEDISDEEGTLDLSEQEALERYRSNVDNALFNVLKTAVETGTIDEEEAEEIIEEANGTIQDAGKQFDLNRPVTPIDRTVGVDPAQQQQREQQRQQAEQKKQQQVQQKEEKKQEITTNNASVIQQVVQAAQELQQANQQAQEQKQQEATEKLLGQLTEQQRQALQQRVEQKKQEAQQQQQQQQPQEQPNETPTTVATTTTVELSKSEAVVGEALTITATVKNNSTNAAVPNGTTVTFRKGTTSIGTATTTDGKAVLNISQSQSATVFPMGTHAVNAVYAGTSTLQSSTSMSQSLTVKSNTDVEITGPTSSAVGAQFTLSINVAAVSPGSGTPAGTVELYDSSLKIGEKTLIAGSTSFDIMPSETTATTKTYRAVYKPSTAALYKGNEKVHTHSIVVPTPSSPSVTLTKTDTTEGFNIAVKLDNFIGTKKLQGMQIHFVSKRNLIPMALPTGQTHYNATKFTNAAQTVELFDYKDGLDASQQEKRELIYSMVVFGTGAPVAFDENETMATIKIQRTSMGDTLDNIQYVYAQFVFEDGTSYVPDVTFSANY